MAIDNVKINLDFGKNIRKILNSTQSKNEIGEVLKEEVLRSVSKGISPIKGYGRFEGYKVDRAGDSKNKSYYPNNVKKKYPRKRKRPVNLKLSGEYLNAIDYKSTHEGIRFGFLKMNKSIRKKYNTNNLGMDENVPERKIIPTVQGETYSTKIINRIKETYNKIIKKKLRLK